MTPALLMSRSRRDSVFDDSGGRGRHRAEIRQIQLDDLHIPIRRLLENQAHRFGGLGGIAATQQDPRAPLRERSRCLEADAGVGSCHKSHASVLIGNVGLGPGRKVHEGLLVPETVDAAVVGSASLSLSTGAVSTTATEEATQARQEAARRRTFAIISHPDAGKTTLTEKLLLYGGQLSAGAGSVKARSGGRSSTSDWMELEKQRGISVSSTVVQFDYRDCVINLLDTPGHRDFSEDTYRVLAATDAAVMVLDAAKGIEPQTRKLFEVCRAREVPILTFINKWDRPGLEPLELLDEIEDTLVIEPVPVTWPVGRSGDFRGVLDRRSNDFIRYTRTEHGATIAPEERVPSQQAADDEGEAWTHAVEGVELLEAVGRDYDSGRFEEGELSPVYFGSALTNFGVAPLLDALVEKIPAPSPRLQADGGERPVDSPFSGIVFKVQANMDRSHRDRIAFLRVCSGHFTPRDGRHPRPYRQALRHEVCPLGEGAGTSDRG